MSDASMTRIALAREHVRRGLEFVARQRALIDRVRLVDGPVQDREELLRTFEATLAIFEDDLRRLEKEAADTGRVASGRCASPPLNPALPPRAIARAGGAG